MQKVKGIKALLEFIDPYDPGLFPEDLTDRYGIPENRIVNLGSNENPYPFPSTLLEKMLKELSSINRYPNPSYREVKESIAEYTGFATEHIAIGNGASDIIDLICKITLSPLDKVVMPVPTYTLYMLTSMIWEASLTYVETEKSDFRVTAEEIRPYLDDARLVFLGSPNNPTGRSVEKHQMQEMLKTRETLFIVDETYFEFSGKSVAELINNYPNLIVIRSLSKFYSFAGGRLGYALAHPSIVRSLEKVRLPFNVNSFAHRAVNFIFTHQSYFKKIGRKIISERSHLISSLKKLGLKLWPSNANFFIVKLSDGYTAEEFTTDLAQNGIIIRNLKNLIGLTGEYVRITVGTSEENRRFLQVCKRLLKGKRANFPKKYNM